MVTVLPILPAKSLEGLGLGILASGEEQRRRVGV